MYMYIWLGLKVHLINAKLVGVRNIKALPPSLTLNAIFSWRLSSMSHVMRKSDFCMCENKGADQLRVLCGNLTAD